MKTRVVQSVAGVGVVKALNAWHASETFLAESSHSLVGIDLGHLLPSTKPFPPSHSLGPVDSAFLPLGSPYRPPTGASLPQPSSNTFSQAREVSEKVLPKSTIPS